MSRIAQLFTRSARPSSIARYCVFFLSSAATDHNYPCFWSSDQRECELFIEIGSKPETLGMLDKLYQSDQFALFDNLLQEIENETLKKRRAEEIDAENAPRNPGVFNNRDSAG